jgi:hypothetical protein
VHLKTNGRDVFFVHSCSAGEAASPAFYYLTSLLQNRQIKKRLPKKPRELLVWFIGHERPTCSR